jgi:hypothetical protein
MQGVSTAWMRFAFASVLAFVASAAIAEAGITESHNHRLGLKVDARGAKVGATLIPRQDPMKLAVRLNGKRIEDIFDYAPPKGRRVVIGLDEGVRFGSNTLKARAVYPDGEVVKR